MSAVLMTTWAELPPKARALATERACRWGVDHPATSEPSQWARLNHAAAHRVCGAALEVVEPNMVVHTALPDDGLYGLGYLTLPGMALPTPVSLRREAIVLLVGPTVESATGGDFYGSPAELASVACIAARLGWANGTDAEAAMREIMLWTASVTGACWDDVCTVARMMMGQSAGGNGPAVSRSLDRVRGSISLTRLPDRTGIGEQVARYLDEACIDVIALASDLTREFGL